jgi:nucleotide-binding universal stress UspA family protein
VRVLGLDEDTLESLVLDVEVGEPADRHVARAAPQPQTHIVLPAPPENLSPDPLALGRLASRVLTAHTSVGGVIVVRGEARPSPKLGRILVPLDGTPTTARAITPAGYIARRACADLDIVHVGVAGDDVDAAAPHEPGSMTTPQYVDQPHHEWAAFSDEFLHRFLSALAHCSPEVKAHMFLGVGDPATEILRWAERLGTDLIVLAWHGHLDVAPQDAQAHEAFGPSSGTRPRGHGAIVRDVLRGAHCPVLVLRT